MKMLSVLTAIALLAFGLSQVAPASPVSDGTATASRTATVRIVDFSFRPASLNVGKGTKVVFSNTASRAHTATRDGGFDTGRIKAGRSASVRFERKGTFRYHCKIHPEMVGKVVVG